MRGDGRPHALETTNPRRAYSARLCRRMVRVSPSTPETQSMADPHYVRDYEAHVRNLKATLPIDDAMSEAVGGHFDHFGAVEVDALRYAGLKDGMDVLDFGCGSGRLAIHLSKAFAIGYLGIDVVQDLIDYAASRTPKHYRYLLSRTLAIPAETASADVIACFSVFTHLTHAETYAYLEEMRRILKRGGRLVVSFLEFADPEHWRVFETTLAAHRAGQSPHLNQFIERSQIEVWAQRLDMRVVEFVAGRDSPWTTSPSLGQAIAILERA